MKWNPMPEATYVTSMKIPKMVFCNPADVLFCL